MPAHATNKRKQFSRIMTNLQGFQGLLLTSQNENTLFVYSSSASQTESEGLRVLS